MTLPNDMGELATLWLNAKKTEEDAVNDRRNIEDHLKKLARIAEDFDGTETIKHSGVEIKITGRIDRKVDSEKVQELAAEHGLSAHLGSLFRWKPEINMAAWKAADDSITHVLAPAITAKAGRPSFKIVIKE